LFVRLRAFVCYAGLLRLVLAVVRLRSFTFARCTDVGLLRVGYVGRLRFTVVWFGCGLRCTVTFGYTFGYVVRTLLFVTLFAFGFTTFTFAFTRSFALRYGSFTFALPFTLRLGLRVCCVVRLRLPFARCLHALSLYVSLRYVVAVWFTFGLRLCVVRAVPYGLRLGV